MEFTGEECRDESGKLGNECVARWWRPERRDMDRLEKARREGKEEEKFRRRQGRRERGEKVENTSRGTFDRAGWRGLLLYVARSARVSVE